MERNLSFCFAVVLVLPFAWAIPSNGQRKDDPLIPQPVNSEALKPWINMKKLSESEIMSLNVEEENNSNDDDNVVSVTPWTPSTKMSKRNPSSRAETNVECGSETQMASGQTYIIKSPNYPEPYGDRERCLTTFFLPDSPPSILFWCDSFDVLCNKRLGGDYVEFDLDGLDTYRICNRNFDASGGLRITTFEFLDILFRSNKRNSGNGYQCYLTLEDVGPTTTPVPTTPQPTATTTNSNPATTTPSSNEICNVCGQDMDSRIINGENAVQGSVPWQALIYIQYSSGSYMCGATLIGKRSLITAAHCVEGAVQQVRLYLGAHSRNNLPSLIVLSGSSQIIVHENYNSRTLANDIAVLRLPSDVTFNNDIAPACLPGDYDAGYGPMRAWISGWGATSSGGSTATILQVAPTLTTAKNQCNPWDRTNYWTADTHICVYDEANGAVTNMCQGDSGGPVTIDINGRQVVLGAASYTSASGCDIENYANVYIRVQHFLKNGWIQDKIGDGDFCEIQ